MSLAHDLVARTLSTFLGGAYLNDFNSFGRLYKVYMQAAPEFRDSVGDLSSFFVRSASGAMVPLSALVVTEMINGPATTNRFNLARAAELVGTPAQGYSSTAALDALEEVAKEVLPSTFSFEWNALSFQERRAPAALGVIALGLLFVPAFFVLLHKLSSRGVKVSQKVTTRGR